MGAPSTASGTSPAMPPWGWAAMVAGGGRGAQGGARAEKPHGGRPARALPVPRPRTEPAQPGLRRIAVKAPAEQAYVALAFRVPGLARLQNLDEADHDALALQMLS